MEFKNIFESYKLKFPEKKTGTRNRRDEIINRFMEVLNSGRLSNGYKELSAGFIVSKMARAGIKSEQDLYWFLRYCEDAQNFSSTWWWSLNAKNAK